MAESERQKLDLNIDNWSVEDLYDLFDIPKNASTNKVASMADKVIERQTEGEIKYFLQLARNKIIKAQQSKLEGDQYTERTDEQLKVWWENQYLTTGDATQAEKATIRTNKVEIFDDDNGHYQMKQNRLGVNNTHNVPFIQGTMNPTLVNEVERTVIIDSQYRTNIYPYSGGIGAIDAGLITNIVNPVTGDFDTRSVLGNASAASFNTDFTITLSEDITNVIELKLDSVSIPKRWDNYSSWIGNVRFGIRDLSDNLNYLVQIQNCNPSSYQDLTDKINSAIEIASNIPYDESGFFYGGPSGETLLGGPALPGTYNTLSDDIHFGYDESAGRIYINTVSGEDIVYDEDGPDYFKKYEIIFFDADLFAKPDYSTVIAKTAKGVLSARNCFNVSYTNNNLGWYLGWRLTPNEDNVTKILYSTGGFAVYADTTPKLKSIDYLVIVLDDFNKNRLNTGIISGIQQSSKLPIPNYTNADNLNCNEEGSQPFFSKVAPRQLTQAQLYTINSIVEDRQKSKNRNAAPTLSDAFCTIPVPSNIEQNDRIVLYSNQLSTSIRKYFGPVNIERFRAALYDDKGNIVNLKGHDWNITLKAKQLYQY